MVNLGSKEDMSLSEEEEDLVYFMKTYLNLVCFLLMDFITSGQEVDSNGMLVYSEEGVVLDKENMQKVLK